MGLALILAGCNGVHKVSVDVAFDVDADGRATSAKCVASSGGACQIDFRGAAPMRVVLQQGEMRRFPNIGPGVPVCVEAEAAALEDCRPITLDAGYARIRKAHENRLAGHRAKNHANGAKSS
jgi:hypothetical protein